MLQNVLKIICLLFNVIILYTSLHNSNTPTFTTYISYTLNNHKTYNYTSKDIHAQYWKIISKNIYALNKVILNLNYGHNIHYKITYDIRYSQFIIYVLYTVIFNCIFLTRCNLHGYVIVMPFFIQYSCNG